MTNKAVRIDVRGMDEFRRALKQLDSQAEIEDQLKDVNKDVADLVVQKARARAFTPLQRKAAESLKAARQLRRAAVSGGGARYPFFGGAEFGADRGISRIGPRGRRYVGHNQFEPWRGSSRDAGYFLYPAIRDNTEELVEMYGDAIDQLTRKAFPD